MSWCCSSKKGARNDSSSGKGRGAAPTKQSMKDRDGMNDDERAVDWWRKRNLSKDENDAAGTEGTRPDSRATTFEMLDQQNALQRPYEIPHREPPLNPKKGDVLHPPLSTLQPTHRNSSDPARNASNPQIMEIFRPEVSGGWSDQNRLIGSLNGQQQGRIDGDGNSGQRQTRGNMSERITSIEPAGSEDFLDDPLPHSHDPVAMQFPEKGSLLLSSPDEERQQSGLIAHKNRKRSSKDTRRVSAPIPQLRKKNTTSAQMQKRNVIGFGKTKTKKRSTYKDNDEDHLSDVPSDVDSVTKDRYLLACQMLKNAMVQKEMVLEPLEREFLLSLLNDYENHLDETSVISEDHISAVEQATLRLENDPLFQETDDADKEVARSQEPISPPSAMAAAARQLQENFQKVTGRSQDNTKHPHTATRATPRGRMPFISNPCNPRTLDDVESPADIVLIIRDEDDQDDPDYSDEDSTDDKVSETNQIIRFDGWSNQQSAEYPFLILGAEEDSQLKPRVFTPSNMEALRGFFPYSISESNFWLKFSLVRDGASLSTLLSSIRTSTYTIIGVETKDGEVFGSFTGSPWRVGTRWFGTGEAFLWRLKKPRFTSARNADHSNFENEMEVYPYTGNDDLVQYCTTKTIAVGGGDWIDSPSPFPDEPRGIGFMIDGDLVGGETNSCATFANPRLCRKATASNEFTITNLEVWTLTPCLNTKSAAKMEVQKLFVEEAYR